MTVTVRGPDPVAFAPYGAFVDPPAAVGERALFSQWLEPVVGRSQQAHVNRVPCSALPLTIDRVECHPHAAQLFVPMGEVTRREEIVGRVRSVRPFHGLLVDTSDGERFVPAASAQVLEFTIPTREP